MADERGMLLPVASYLGHRVTEHGLNPVLRDISALCHSLLFSGSESSDH